MGTTPIDPFSDPRIEHKTAVLNGHTYHYLYGEPKDGNFRATIFLIHGWPDLSFGWRYQIPPLLEMGLRVVVPDLMGYGGTDAPRVPPESIHLYGYKRASDDIAELAKQLGAKKIILGGHDWGGAVVFRAAQWHPELVSHLFSICTPYMPVMKQYMSTEALVKGPLPQFGYQLHLAGPEVEATIQTKEQIRQFLNGIYGGRGPNGELAFDPVKGILFDNLPKLGKSKLLSDKELHYYVDQYARNGLHGPLNWYRTREANFKDDQGIQTQTIRIPTLFVQANHDNVLQPAMSKDMEKYIPSLTRAEVDATHWILMQKPDEVNAVLQKWLVEVAFGGRSVL